MQHHDGKHAEIDGVMSNLEFFASAPIGTARRALALAEVIVDGRRDHAPKPPGSRGSDSKPDTGTTTGQPEPGDRDHDEGTAATTGSGASTPPATATPSAGKTQAAAAAQRDPEHPGAAHERSAPAAEPPRQAAASAVPEKTPARHNPRVKVTAETVHAIRRAYDGSWASAVELGKRYGITPGNVQKIACRARWNHLPAEPGEYVPAEPARPGPPGGHKPRRKMDVDTVLAIRREFGRTPAKTLAKRHGTSVQTIRDIGNRRTWKHVSPQAAESGPEQPEQTSGADRIPKTGTPATTQKPAQTPKAGTPAATQKPALRRQDAQDTDLSARQVREIRRHAKTAGRTKETIAKLADEFDVPPATIDAVLDRRAWSHLQPRDDEYDPLGQSVWNGRTPLT